MWPMGKLKFANTWDCLTVERNGLKFGTRGVGIEQIVVTLNNELFKVIWGVIRCTVSKWSATREALAVETNCLKFRTRFFNRAYVGYL